MKWWYALDALILGGLVAACWCSGFPAAVFPIAIAYMFGRGTGRIEVKRSLRVTQDQQNADTQP